MQKITGSIVTVWLLLVLAASSSSAYDDSETHPELTRNALTFSTLDSYLLQNLGFAKGADSSVNGMTIIDRIAEGAKLEDAGLPPYCRRSTHFHNPLMPWNRAGMSDLGPVICYGYNSPGYGSKYSTLVWATGYESHDGSKVTPKNQAMGWDNGRDYFYTALTATNDNDRNTNFANTFQAVGQVLHLLQDMAVPAHVRDDFITSHLIQSGMSNPYEDYVKKSEKHTNLIANLGQESERWRVDAVRPDFSAPKVTDFWDTIEGAFIAPQQILDPSLQTRAGLAEYSNANFLSEGTDFSTVNSFAYPAKDSTRIIVLTTQENSLKRPYFYKEGDWDVGYILAGADALSVAKAGLSAAAYSNTQKMVPLDKNVHQAYAERLIPRAIGYSAALLDYFFRGTLEISQPDAGVYSIADGSRTLPDAAGNDHQRFTMLRAKVRNTTPNDEPIGAGTLTAVARYKIIPNYAPDLSNYPPDAMAMKAVPYSYSISQARPVSEVPRSYAEYDFQFIDAPIPAGITDLTLQVVFKGTLGNEVENAVAVGMKDLMEPTHLTFWNLTDMHSIDYPGPEFKLYTFDSLKKLADGDGGLLSDLDDTPIGAPNGILDDEQWLRGQTDTIDIYFRNGTEYQQAVSVDVPEKGHVRMIVLVDQPKVQFLWLDTLETGGGIGEFNAAVNQADKDGKYPPATPVEKYRKVKAVEGQEGVLSVQHYYDGVYRCTMLHSADCNYPIADADAVSDKPVSFTSQFY